MEEEEPPCLYTRRQVIEFLKQQRANVQDYVMLTYFSINNITDGPLFHKYKRRFNNIIINNSKEVSRNLTMSIFKKKADEILAQELAQVRYVSVIYPNIYKGVAPVIVQFFNPRTGVQHRVLDFPNDEIPQLGAILSRYGVLSKLVGYCGDYCFKDSAFVNISSDRMKSVRTLSMRCVLDLPYAETFINRLFDILIDYLPGDVIKSVTRLGDTLLGLTSQSQLAADVVRRYKVYLNSSQHILSSEYLDFVISNYDAIHSYLYPFRNLPECVGTLFDKVPSRYLLIFMKEMYREIDKIELRDNNAVVYYYYLRRILDMLEYFRDNHYIPANASLYLRNQIEELEQVNMFDSGPDAIEISKMLEELTLTIDVTYARAVAYIEPLLKPFNKFLSFSWILLSESSIPIKYDQVHETFHALISHESCDDRCQDLIQEVKCLNTLLPRLPLLELPSVTCRWLLLLKECQNDKIPIVTDLLEYLCSLPCNYSVTDDLGGENTFDCIEKFVRINMKSVQDVDVEKVQEFFDGYMTEAKQVVEDASISILID